MSPHHNPDNESKLSDALKTIEEQERFIKKLLQEKYEPIAIVGYGLRFPGNCFDENSLQEMLLEGRDAVAPIPENRWENRLYYDPNPGTKGKICTNSGGYIRDHDGFDAKFFSISPKEASYIDPQQRLMLEVAWEALENSNINPETIKGGMGGVYVGISSGDYANHLVELKAEELDSHIGTGMAFSAASGRLSYLLGLRGPSISIDTACSSSLVALHLAVNGLRKNECNFALCGAVHVIQHPFNHIIFSQANMLAPDGRCKTFDQRADGYGRSEGCGVLVLKRLSDAQKVRDRILCVIKGSAVCQDGESGGLTVPNGQAQEAVMRKAIANALLEPSDISYVEAHGTGTPLGDPIEMRSIQQVFGTSYTKDAPLYVGSIKTNIGHMEAAAGIGGILKVILQLQARKIYPHINYESPSKHIPWDSIPVKIPRRVIPWCGVKNRALINSFGFAGTVASVVLEEAPATKTNPHTITIIPEKQRGNFLLTLSAKSRRSLAELLMRLRAQLNEMDESQIGNLCYTSNIGRAHFAYREGALVSTKADVIAFLDRVLQQSSVGLGASIATLEHRKYKRHGIAFLFTGQGSQYRSMGKTLYRNYPVFKQVLDLCDHLFHSHLGYSIKGIIFGKCGQEGDLNNTINTQPALFTVEYALAQLWMSWGVQPSILLGHSIGEIAAAAVARVFSLEDAIKLVATRARLMQSVSHSGTMVAVRGDAEHLAHYLEGINDASFAAINSPSQCVISGGTQSLQRICARMEKDNIEYKQLPVSHAFHSPLMGEILTEFTGVVSEIRFQEPIYTIVSNISGERADVSSLTTPQYWVRHISEPVLFAKGIKTIDSKGAHVFIEIGPNPHLTSLGKQSAANAEHLWLPSLQGNDDELQCLHKSVLMLYRSGININWPQFHKDTGQSLTRLPTYPFDRKRYWLPKSSGRKHASTPMGGNHQLLGQVTQTATGEWEFSAEITPDSPAFLADHVVMDQIVFPAAAYLEMVLALQDAVLGRTDLIAKDIRVLEPLFLKFDEPTRLVTKLTKSEDKGNSHYCFDISSYAGAETIAHHHVRGELAANDTKIDFSSLIADFNCDKKTTLHTDQFYENLENKGLQYGPAFRKLISVQKTTPRMAVGKLETVMAQPFGFLDPGLLDSVLQTADQVVEDEHTYLPVTFERFVFFKKPKHTLESRLLRRNTSDNPQFDVCLDLVLLDNGEPVFLLQGFGMKKILVSKANKTKHSLHVQKWIKQTIDQSKPAKSVTRPVVLLGQKNSALEQFQHHLTSLGFQVQIVSRLDDVDVQSEAVGGYQDIVYFWESSPGEPVNKGGVSFGEQLERECRTNYSKLAAVIAGLDKKFHSRTVKLWLVTKGAQILPEDSKGNHTNRLVQASLWGYGAVLLNEYPKFQCTLVDLDPSDGNDGILDNAYDNVSKDNCKYLINNVTQLGRELLQNLDEREHQVAYRNTKRYVRRITALDDRQNEDENFKLHVSEYGTFTNIKKVAIPKGVPGNDEILVRVHAAGLNFKDVLNVLGMLKQYAEQSKSDYKELPLGFECAGTVLEAGKEARFKPGDQVIVSHIGSMQRYITVPSSAAVKKPLNIGFAEAAALPTAYLTSYYALHYLAKIKKGDKVLVHAAAGGVGQAAIQLARRVGAEVYATASRPKWAFLKAQGVDHIMDSRSLDFEQQVMDLTGSQGVDIVLNSLNKEYIPAGLRCLAKNGRFIEIGKIGIWSEQQVKDFRGDVGYFNFDLSEIPQQEFRRLNEAILQQVSEYLAAEEISPVPTAAYHLDELEEAFSLLSRGANTGKIALTFIEDRKHSHNSLEIKPDRSYLVTGGFGELGLRAAKWLADQGATYVVLMGRTIPDAHKLRQIEEAVSLNTSVCVLPLRADVANQDEVAEAFKQLKQHPPIAGIVHTAGVLSDAPVASQDWESLNRVFAPKIYGTWNLHAHACNLQNLDFFIAYSSIASVVGNAMQSNYAAANAFIDSLMQWRSQQGLPGFSANWGPWAEIGMAVKLGKNLVQSIEEKGIKFIKPAQAMKSLQKAVNLADSHALIGEIQWNKFIRSLTVGNALFDRVCTGVSNQGVTALDMDALKKLPRNERLKCIIDEVRTKTAGVLRFESAEEIDEDARFTDLGLDSLVAVELKNVLEVTIKQPLQASIIFDYPDIPSMAEYIMEKLFPEAVSDKTQEATTKIREPNQQNERIVNAETEVLIAVD